MAERLET